MNVTQRQNLLQYLGYYEGKIDGIWGSGCGNATREFQKDNGIGATGICDAKTDELLKSAVFYGKFKPAASTSTSTSGGYAKYFRKEEFACKCGGKYCNGHPVEMNKTLLTVADRVREHFGKAVHVSSGVRCKQHNANVGGVSGSRHQAGKAMDFRVIGYTSKQVLAYVQQQPEIRYSYAIDGTYVHMDVN